jgi:hypothetical protein
VEGLPEDIPPGLKATGADTGAKVAVITSVKGGTIETTANMVAVDTAAVVGTVTNRTINAMEAIGPVPTDVQVLPQVDTGAIVMNNAMTGEIVLVMNARKVLTLPVREVLGSKCQAARWRKLQRKPAVVLM